MKKYIPTLLAVVTLTALGTAQANAKHDKALHVLGGFIGGVITSQAFEKHYDRRPAKVVYVEKSSSRYRKNYDCDDGYRPKVKYRRSVECCPGGYYEKVRVRQWVPGKWETCRDHHGNRIERWTEGYHKYVTKRVWRENRCDHREHYAYRHR